jgi:hypothetical protein
MNCPRARVETIAQTKLSLVNSITHAKALVECPYKTTIATSETAHGLRHLLRPLPSACSSISGLPSWRWLCACTPRWASVAVSTARARGAAHYPLPAGRCSAASPSPSSTASPIGAPHRVVSNACPRAALFTHVAHAGFDDPTHPNAFQVRPSSGTGVTLADVQQAFPLGPCHHFSFLLVVVPPLARTHARRH